MSVLAFLCRSSMGRCVHRFFNGAASPMIDSSLIGHLGRPHSGWVVAGPLAALTDCDTGRGASAWSSPTALPPATIGRRCAGSDVSEESARVVALGLSGQAVAVGGTPVRTQDGCGGQPYAVWRERARRFAGGAFLFACGPQGPRRFVTALESGLPDEIVELDAVWDSVRARGARMDLLDGNTLVWRVGLDLGRRTVVEAHLVCRQVDAAREGRGLLREDAVLSVRVGVERRAAPAARARRARAGHRRQLRRRDDAGVVRADRDDVPLTFRTVDPLG